MLEEVRKELRRLRGELVILALSVGVLLLLDIGRGNMGLLFYKLALLAMASIAAHILRQLVFEYVCLEDTIFGHGTMEKVPVPIRCAVVVMTYLVYVTMIYGIMIGG